MRYLRGIGYVLKEQLVTNTTASSNSHVSWKMEDKYTCGGQNLQNSPAVSRTDVRASVWRFSQSSQDKGHLHWFSCTVAAGEHRTSWAVHLRMSRNHWLVKSSFYPTHNAEAQNGPAAGLFPPYKWHALWSSSTAALRNICDGFTYFKENFFAIPQVKSHKRFSRNGRNEIHAK